VACSDTDAPHRSGTRTGIPSVQIAECSLDTRLYAFTVAINRLEYDPAYPKVPQTFGQLIRKTRMDRGIMIKDLAALLGTDENTIINWELRGTKPTFKCHRKGLVEFLGPGVYDGRIPTVWPLLGPKGDSASVTTHTTD